MPCFKVVRDECTWAVFGDGDLLTQTGGGEIEGDLVATLGITQIEPGEIGREEKGPFDPYVVLAFKNRAALDVVIGQLERLRAAFPDDETSA